MNAGSALRVPGGNLVDGLPPARHVCLPDQTEASARDIFSMLSCFNLASYRFGPRLYDFRFWVILVTSQVIYSGPGHIILGMLHIILIPDYIILVMLYIILSRVILFCPCVKVFWSRVLVFFLGRIV